MSPDIQRHLGNCEAACFRGSFEMSGRWRLHRNAVVNEQRQLIRDFVVVCIEDQCPVDLAELMHQVPRSQLDAGCVRDQENGVTKVVSLA
jgi:hypothetical protein